MRALALLVVAGCTTFEDPTIVLDLRVIGMTTTAPEQVVDVPLDHPPTVDDLTRQMFPSLVEAEAADPAQARSLRWSMRACLLDDNFRCDPARPQAELDSGVIDDPERSGVEMRTFVPVDGLTPILIDSFEQDPLHGLGGIDYAIGLQVGGVDDDPALDVLAFKQMRVSARLPASRMPNRNPELGGIQMSRENGEEIVLIERQCAPEPLIESLVSVRPGEKVLFFPVETVDVHETYPAATIDGTFKTITESISYQWLAGAGKFQDESTGGAADVFGNVKLVGTHWTAPSLDQLRTPVVQVWIIQRDERYGVKIHRLCLAVTS